MIEGRTVRLRDLRLADIEEYQKWLQPGHQWRKLDAPYEPNPTPSELEQQLSRLAEAARSNQWPSPRKRLVIANLQNDRLIGTVSWYGITEASRWPRLGIAIYDPSFWGQGCGYEALGLWCDYLWRAFPNTVRLGLSTWSGNPGMIALACKLGFQEEARFRKAQIVDGKYYDSLGCGILYDEWQSRFPQGFAASLGIPVC